MSVILYKLLWFSQDTEVAVNLTDAITLNSDRGLEIRNNSLSFNLKNAPTDNLNDDNVLRKAISKDNSELLIQEEDTFKIFIHQSDDFNEIESNVWSRDNIIEPSSDYLKGVYFVVDRAVQQSETDTPIKITCVDKTYILFNRLLAESFPKSSSSGTTTSTSSNKLVDSGASFLETANVGMLVSNTSVSGKARVTAIDSSTTLSLSEDIFTSGQGYNLEWTAPSILQKVIRFSSENPVGEFLGTGSDAGVQYDVDARMETDEGGFIQDVRKNTFESGESNTELLFPGKSISKIWKAVYEWADELSEIEFLNYTDELEGTGGKSLVYGRKFLLWVDELNRVHWTETSNTVNQTIVIGEDKGIYDYQLTRSSFDVINFVVYRGGEDFYGNGNLNYVIDTSVNANIKKMHVVAMTDIAAKLIDAEIAKGNLVLNASGSFTYSGNRYNRNGTVTAEWNDTAYSTDSGYNSALRDEIDRLGNNRARAIVSGRNTSRYKGKIVIKGRVYNAGDLLKVTNPNTGQVDTLIRVVDVRDSLNGTEWVTTLQLEQDDEALIGLE